jgi:predicted enzyme related to lactoylglutathione lyase
VVTNVIDYIELAVDDLEEAKAFYGKALGWTFKDYGPDYAGIQDPTRPGEEFGGLNRVAASARGDGVVALARPTMSTLRWRASWPPGAGSSWS